LGWFYFLFNGGAVNSIKLSEVSFDEIGIRKLKNIKIPITERITLIAGHNAIGKSTILGIIANSSGMRTADYKSFFEKAYQSKFEELFFLDHCEILPQGQRGHAFLAYRFELKDDNEINYCTTHIKKSNIGKNTTISSVRPRLIPRSEDKPHSEELGIGGGDGKIPLPTIYLGMSRMTPIGEFQDEDISKRILKNIDDKDKFFIYETFNKIIRINNSNNNIVAHDFKGSKKRSKVPEMDFNTLSISLGQDSVSAIVTALASFYKLKRDLSEKYIGGVLVIDEIESGLHPKAQMNLIDVLKKVARDLQLQIIATTHSLTIIKSALKDQEDQGRFVPPKDSVVYLQDTRLPRPMPFPTYEKIKNDMLLSIDEVRELPSIKIYFEDQEALYFFNKIIGYLELEDHLVEFGRELKLISASLGCDTLIKLNNADDYFKNVIILLDNDVLTKSTYKDTIDTCKNIITLPGSNTFTPSTPAFQRNPENIIYNFLDEKLVNYSDFVDFWRECTYSTDYVEQNILNLNSTDLSNNVVMKKWFNKNIHHFDKMRIIEKWCLANNSSVQKFKQDFFESIDHIQR
jgi:AAA15 family ATPase/GTPase